MILEFDIIKSTIFETNELSEIFIKFFDEGTGTLSITISDKSNNNTYIILENTHMEANYMIQYIDGSETEWSSYLRESTYNEIVDELKDIYSGLNNITNINVSKMEGKELF